MRKDAVSPELAAYILKRDDGCVAPRLDPATWRCWGTNGIEHVKKEARMGKRAEPLKNRLVTLCEGHREPGMTAGYIWCTAKINRERCRDYLRRVEPDEVR